MLASMYGGCHSLDVSSVHQEKYVIIDFNAIQMKLPKRLYIQKTTEKKKWRCNCCYDVEQKEASMVLS